MGGGGGWVVEVGGWWRWVGGGGGWVVEVGGWWRWVGGGGGGEALKTILYSLYDQYYHNGTNILIK